MPQHSFVLKLRPPFRLDLTVWALRRRANNEMDRWDGQSYRRTLALDGTAADVTVARSGQAEAPRLIVTVDTDRSSIDIEPMVTRALERLLGLNADLDAFYVFAAGDPRLAPLAQRFRGFKPPRFATPFEALVNAVACQQLSLAVGILLLNRLAQRFGAHAGTGHAFPTPQELARRRPGSLHALGFSRQKTRALIGLARALTAGELDLERIAGEDDATAMKSLCALHGVGRWSAEYVLLRGFGRTHVFPGDDVGARNNLRRWLRRDRQLDYDGVQRVLEPWRPYGGLIYMHLLLDHLSQRQQP